MNAPALSPLRRTRAHLAAPVAEVAAPELQMLLRLLLFGVLLAGAMSVYLWASTGVRETAIRIDRKHRELERARIDQERLVLERAMLRGPGRLGQDAAALGLVAPEATIDLSGGASAR